MCDSEQKTVCENCGEEFTPNPDTEGKYCSLVCVGEGSRGRRKPFANYTITTDGYAVWRGSQVVDDDARVYVHRLLAVAKYGFDEVGGRIVHHDNGLSWDNRPDNIDVMTQSEHAAHHNKKLSWLDRLRITELYQNGNISQSDLGDLFGIDGSYVSRVKNDVLNSSKTSEEGEVPA